MKQLRKLRSLIKLPLVVHEYIVIIDSRFPRPLPFGFRNNEITEYFKKIPKFKSYSMYPMKPGKEAWFTHNYGVEKDEFERNKNSYLKYYPEFKNRIKYLNPNKKYDIKLAYILFLAETYTLLPFLEKNNIDFIFVLYPGGGFGLDNESSDNMLKAIFNSPNFKKVIATKNVTYDYLINKKLCPKKEIEFMNGILQFRQKDVQKRRYYHKDKKNLDICFVGHKYSDKGIDKGYDLFVESAKLLAKDCKNIRFHVIGNFDEKVIDVSEIKPYIKFHGFKRPKELLKMYKSMDILLSPNRKGKLYEGNFDGFPIGGDAGFCGVALLVTDELNQNIYLRENEEFIKIKPKVSDIVEKIEYFYKHPNELILISKNGKVGMQREFNMDEQLNMRIQLFNKIMDIECKR